MMIWFDFESDKFRAALELFKHMEIVGAIYEGDGLHYQTKQPRADSNQASGRKNR